MVEVLEGDCIHHLRSLCETEERFHLTFLDPPFNQGKEYDLFEDDLPAETYWQWMEHVCQLVYRCSAPGAAICFMQREKNTEQVLRVLRETGWSLQNLIIWMKRTSAVPNINRYGKQYQIIAFATKGEAPRVFHRLRIDAPLRPEHRQPREDGVFVADCWDDIRELTSGYFAGDEALRAPDGERFHKQQSPVRMTSMRNCPAHIQIITCGDVVVVSNSIIHKLYIGEEEEQSCGTHRSYKRTARCW